MIFVHLNNGYTGSVKVLSVFIDQYSKNNESTLITSFSSPGFLKINERLNCINIGYLTNSNKLLKLFSYFKFQLIAFFHVVKLSNKEVIYINTIEPFLFGILCKLFGFKVISHLHEHSVNYSIYSKICYKSMFLYAEKIICVSNFLYDSLPQRYRNKSVVVYNAIRDIEVQESKLSVGKNILMISSPKLYKGVYHFCELASLMSEYKFYLVVSADETAINKFFRKHLNITNLSILPSTKDVDYYYRKSDIILNLSDPNLVKETFGMTVLEAKYFGVPAIVPEVGGISELVSEGMDGFKISVHDKQKLIAAIRFLLDDEDIYKKFSQNAINSLFKFNFYKEYDKWKRYIEEN
jgi:glycosyltransferase involved in cell wall biosynthesis